MGTDGTTSPKLTLKHTFSLIKSQHHIKGRRILEQGKICSSFSNRIDFNCLAACNSGKSEDTSSSADTSSSDNGSDTTDTNNNTDTNDTNTSADDCSQAADFVACATCFAQQNPTGSAAYNNAIQTNCVCANECIVECEAACDDINAMDQTCNDCVNTTGADQQSACFQDFAAECGASQDCVTYSQQVQTCPQ